MTASNDFGPTVNAVVWLLVSLSTTSVLLRLFVRFKERHNAWWDDYLMALSSVLNIGTAIATTIAVATGTGKHVKDINPADIPRAGYVNLIANSLAIFNVTVPKISVGILLARLLNPNRFLRGLLLGLPMFGVLLAVLVVSITYGSCSPVAGQWNPMKYPQTKCWEPSIIVGISFLGGVYAAFLDLTFAIYPATVFARLQMPTGQKAGVSILMGLGIVAAAFAIYKCTLLPLLGQREDLTYTSAKVILWSLIEANAVIIAACAPTIKPCGKIIRSTARSWRLRLSSYPRSSSYGRFGRSESEDGLGEELEPVKKKDFELGETITRQTEVRRF